MKHCWHDKESENGHGQCPKCWDKFKSICPGCHREITNKAYFGSVHMKGTCRRDKGFEVPKPLATQKPAKYIIRPATDQQLETMFGPLPTTYTELREWWSLPRLVYPDRPGTPLINNPVELHSATACGCVYIGLREFNCGFKVAA